MSVGSHRSAAVEASGRCAATLGEEGSGRPLCAAIRGVEANVQSASSPGGEASRSPRNVAVEANGRAIPGVEANGRAIRGAEANGQSVAIPEVEASGQCSAIPAVEASGSPRSVSVEANGRATPGVEANGQSGAIPGVLPRCAANPAVTGSLRLCAAEGHSAASLRVATVGSEVEATIAD